MGVFSVIYSVKDAKGALSTTELQIPDNITAANAILFAQQMALLVQPMMQGRITRIGVAISVNLPGAIPANPGATSDVEEGGLFQFRTALGNYKSMRIPTLNEALVLPGTRTLDITDPVVLAFVTAMTTGINLVPAGGTGTVAPVDTRGEDLVALEKAVEQFQSSRALG